MPRPSRLRAALLLALFLGAFPAPARAAVRLLAPAGHLPGIPVLVQVEIHDATGAPDRESWDVVARLEAGAGTTVSPDAVTLRNGRGSALVTVSGADDLSLTARIPGASDTRQLSSWAARPVTTVAGVLPPGTNTWSGIVHLTNTVTVPTDATLVIASNTLVLVRGVAAGTSGPGLVVRGAIQVLGTENHPVTITCAEPDRRWGQIRHEQAAPSLYRWAIITRAGRAPGEGHTGQAPVLRAEGSTIRFERCAITDHADASGTPGKIGFALDSDLTFDDCLLGRSRMGPEIEGTALVARRTWFTELRGPDDADGIYLHDQRPGQLIRLEDCVLAGGDDDAIDTLGADVDVERCILRDWPNPSEDAKGISAFHGAVRVRRSRIVNCYVGVSGKSSGAPTRLLLEHCTVTGRTNGLHAAFKSNATAGNVEFRVTNSIVRAPVAVRTDFGATNFAIGYSLLGEAWPGTGNIVGDPLFAGEAAGNYHLRRGSPALDAGDPVSAPDPDGSRADLGALPFDASRLSEPSTNVLVRLGSTWRYLDAGIDQGSAWVAPEFDDGAWSTGVAQLGYGDGDEATLVSFGPSASDKRPTTYFRGHFDFQGDPARVSSLVLDLVRDDGAVVHLNGREIFRIGLPAGPVTYATFANVSSDYPPDQVTLSAESLRAGDNVLAIEMHQANRTSSDLSFDLGLSAVVLPPAQRPPEVELVQPADGTRYVTPARIPLVATASDPDGRVTRVEFRTDEARIAEAVAPPFVAEWRDVPEGTHALRAVAYDEFGLTSTSRVVRVVVGPDGVPPRIQEVAPVPGTVVPSLIRVAVVFGEPVTGIDASDLRRNGVPALAVEGTGAGPYVFRFPEGPAGPARLGWTTGHGIADMAGNPFTGRDWTLEVDPDATGIVIHEIFHHPPSEDIREEFIELFNGGPVPVDLGGWRFVAGVQFTFPAGTVVPPGGYHVVVADPATFQARHPDVGAFSGPWTGFLNNRSEAIELVDARGRRVDRVVYADEGDWAERRRGPLDNRRRGWVWHAEHDGLGKSLELQQPSLPNEYGQNWASSLATNGTPGRANSRQTAQLPPMIVDVRHFPPVPRPTEPVLVTARVVDASVNGTEVTVFHRPDAAVPGPFETSAMVDDGTRGDAAAGDGLYSAWLPGRTNGVVVEFYLGATDARGLSRTWPAPALPALDGAGPSGQVVNALYQVDDATYTGRQPLYRLVLAEAERAELAAIPPSSDRNSDAAMNATWIATDGAGTSVRYRVEVRNRGHGSRGANPPNYRVQFSSDETWKGVTALNLNAVQVALQHLGSVVARRAGVAGAETVAAQVRINGINRMPTNLGAQQFGAYAANEAINGDWATRHFPLDPNGNVYRAIRDISPPEFSYRGEEAAAYRNTWFKESNLSEDDWSDLIGMTRVVGASNAVPFTADAAREVANIDQWLRHLALMNLFGNTETGLNSGYNDDYFLYRGVQDPRFILLYYDLDQILGYGGSSGPTSGLFTATNRPAGGGSGFAFGRILANPEFRPLYLQHLRDLCEGVLSGPEFDAAAEQTLGDYVDRVVIDNIKRWMADRRAFVLAQLPPRPAAFPSATLRGLPRSPTPVGSASLRVDGTDLVAYRARLDDGPFGEERDIGTSLDFRDLPDGRHEVRVVGRNRDGVWQPESRATVAFWVIDRSWPSIRLNEVLAGRATDWIELLNEGQEPVDLTGFRVTDDPGRPDRFVFPRGTVLDPGESLVLPSETAPGELGLKLGFGLDPDGDAIFLLAPGESGTRVLDGVTFGQQLPDHAIGRLGTSGDWRLVEPTPGTANRAAATGDPRRLRINEWQAAGGSLHPEDFIEIHNRDPLPVDLGDLSLTDQPIGAPRRHPIPARTFLAGHGYRSFIADGDTDRPGHLGFSLALETGEIGLIGSDGSWIDTVIYGSQWPGIAMGRCPDGAPGQAPLAIPTPGAPNACPTKPPEPVLVALVSLTNIWSHALAFQPDDASWTAPGFDDSGWTLGPAPLGQLTPSRPQTLPEPLRTAIPLASGQITYCFRTRFILPADLRVESLRLRHLVDDGAVFHLNGQELGRFNLPTGPVTRSTLASGVGDATFATLGPVPPNALRPGENVLAVEVHQSSGTSTDLAMAVELLAVQPLAPPQASDPVLNEVLARNTGLPEPDGALVDWVELHNPTSLPLDLGDFGLTDDPARPRRWTFPPGTWLPSLGFLRVRCDGSTPPSATNTGFALQGSGGALYLFRRPADGGKLADAIQYGFQVPDLAIGRMPDGAARWSLVIPTPSAPNREMALADPVRVRLNEWMAAPGSGDDWFELYNPASLPVPLGGLWLSDDPNDRRKYRIPDLSFLGAGPHAFRRLWAAEGEGADFVGFSFKSGGEALVLTASNATLVDAIAFGPQANGVSEGRHPDGADRVLAFSATPTPGQANVPDPIQPTDLDTDTDGMPDAWESAHGLNPRSAEDADADLDGDGFPNLAEFRAGTDPANPSSALRWQRLVLDGAVRRLEFLAVPGRTYSIQYRSEVHAGAWTKLADIPAQSEARLLSIPDPDTAGTRWYRLVTPSVP